MAAPLGDSARPRAQPPGRNRRWLADALRLPWAAVWWNGRKSLYVFGGRQGACPCHDPSDVGEPGRTRCLPVLDWDSPVRFKRVCPLLVRTDHGWCCSVAPEQVRPFWGRFLRPVVLILVALYFVGAGATWVGLCRVGYPNLRYIDLAWPGYWDRVRVCRAEYFRRLGWVAWRRQDYAEALVALSSARQIEPADYETALFLAMLWSSAGNAAYGDVLFAQLAADFPAQTDRTRVVYHDQLLAALRLRPLAALALERRLAGSGNAAWDRPLLFAALHGRLATRLTETNGEEVARLPATPRALIAALRLNELGRGTEAVRQLTDISPASASDVRHGVEALLSMRRPDEAAYLLDLHRRLLSGFEAAILRYQITVAAGERVLAESDFLAALAQPLTADQADRAIATVIAMRDQASLRRLWRHLGPRPAGQGRPVLAAMWVAALHVGDGVIAREAAVRWSETGAERLPPMERLDLAAAGPRQPDALRVVLSTVSLPRETVFALVAEAVKARATGRGGGGVGG